MLNVFSNESGAQSAASNGTAGGSGIDVVGMLTDGMKKTIIDKANAILWQNPAPAEGKPQTAPTGLFNYPGIIQGGNITDTLDPIVDAISLTLSYQSPTALLQDIAELGIWQALRPSNEAAAQEIVQQAWQQGSLKTLTLEIIQGHALRKTLLPENTHLVQFHPRKQ